MTDQQKQLLEQVQKALLEGSYKERVALASKLTLHFPQVFIPGLMEALS